jgi:enoyl-CoA hydratase/carnithine racemase
MPEWVSTEVVSRDDGGRVATLTLDNQARINIVNTPILHELIEALIGLASDDDLRVLVLTGAGERAFFGGADIKEMAALNEDEAERFITLLHAFCQGLREFPVPVIARIDGYALGAGLEVAASCDMRVASERASFGMPEVQVGIPSVIEAALLPRLIGWGRAAELIYTGRTMDAAEALGVGMVEAVVPPGELDAAVASRVESICAAGPQSIRAQKLLLREWEKLPLDEAIETGIRTFRASYGTGEPREFMERFLNRRG